MSDGQRARSVIRPRGASAVCWFSFGGTAPVRSAQRSPCVVKEDSDGGGEESGCLEQPGPEQGAGCRLRVGRGEDGRDSFGVPVWPPEELPS